MENPAVRFRPGEAINAVRKRYRLEAGPELDDDKVRLRYKIHDLSLDDIKSRIPRVLLSGILLSADMLYNDHLRGSDTKKRQAAAEMFLSQLGRSEFLKNLLALDAPKIESKKKEPAIVEFKKP